MQKIEFETQYMVSLTSMDGTFHYKNIFFHELWISYVYKEQNDEVSVQ